MTSSSLAEQLKNLKAPQTGLLLQDKKRASLLYDPKEAANLDRQLVLNIGQTGLEELITLCDLFEEFRGTLFADSSLNFERSVHDEKLNKKLNAGINKFLCLLSPYFLLSAAHKALEWLINRFHIHQFNKDQFLLLILPYHQSKIFIRALQLVSLADSTEKWHWLHSLQKPGVPLSSLTLLNRLSTDDGLLKQLSKHVSSATETFGPQQAKSLSTLYAFYAISLCGAIERLDKVSEKQFGCILPTLLYSLSSQVPDLAASGYMIFAKLTTKVQINDETMEHLLLKLFESPALHQEATILFVFLHQTPHNRQTSIPPKIFSRLTKLKWLVDVLVKIKSSGIEMSTFIVTLIESAIHFILQCPDEADGTINLLTSVIKRVPFDNQEADAILSNGLKQKIMSLDITKECKYLLSELYNSLETQYPESFDRYIQSLMKDSDENADAKLKLHFLMCNHSNSRNPSLEVFDKLNHINPELRIAGLEMIARGEVDFSSNYRELLIHSLVARFADQDLRVVRTMLTFPKESLENIVSKERLIKELLILLLTCHVDEKLVLVKPALKLLLEVCDSGNDTEVFLAALPYLFPHSPDGIDTTMQVLLSDFGKKNSYMKQVKEDIGRSPNIEQIIYAAFHNILNPQLLPPAEYILKAMKDQMYYGDATALFFNIIILGSVCRVPVGSLHPSIAKQAIELAAIIINDYPKVRTLPDSNHINGDNIHEAVAMTYRGYLPIQVGTYVLEMVHRRFDIKANPTFDFENDVERSELILRLLEIYFESLTGPSNKRQTKEMNQLQMHYKWCLKLFFQRHCASAEDVLRLLSQLYTKPVSAQTSYHCLKISLVIIDGCNSVQKIFHDKTFMANLLLALGRENNECRACAVKILKRLLQTLHLKKEGFYPLLEQLASKETEITLDHEQISLALYTLLSPDPDVQAQLAPKLREKLQAIQAMLFDMLLEEKTPMQMISHLLDMLVYVNDTSILIKLAPLGLRLLPKVKSQGGKKNFSENIIKNILQRYNSSTISALKDKSVLELFNSCISDYTTNITEENGSQPMSAILLSQINENFFAEVGKLLPQLQKTILLKIVDIVTDCEVASVVASASKAARKVQINVKLIMNELLEMKKMKTANSAKRRHQKNDVPSEIEIINSKAWKRGITLLEFIQGAENIEKQELLLPLLFDLLKTCMTFDEQSPLEYTNQLLLSIIHGLCLSTSSLTNVHEYVDLVANCIRTTRNPQTHHHALLVLVELFKLADLNLALHSIMPIFTFIGNSVLRQDDTYSIQIISKTIETIVPIVNATNKESHACEVLRIFIAALPDIPEHRRLGLFVKILQLLENHLHLYYLLTFENHVLLKSSKSNAASTNPQSLPERIDFALNLSKEFSPKQLIQVCVKIVQFVKSLPGEDDDGRRAMEVTRFPFKHVFDVTSATAQQTKHYKHTAIQFLGALLASRDLINRIAIQEPEALDEMRGLYDELIVELIILIQKVSKSADIHQGKTAEKFLKTLLNNVYSVLDLVNNLLPNKTFIASVKRLLSHELLPVRKRALELLNVRLQQRFAEEDYYHLYNLIDSLVVIIKERASSTQEQEVIQTALITLKLLAKLLAEKKPAKFKPILGITTKLLENASGPVLGSAVLCVAELCNSMRTQAIQSLSAFVPAILRLLPVHCKEPIPDIVAISIVSALHKIVEAIGNFLSPYLDQLLFELTRVNSLYKETDNQKVAQIVSRLKAISVKLSNSIPLRVLLPAISKTYGILLEQQYYNRIPPLMNILAESFSNIPTSDLSSQISDLATFFLKVLQFREDVLNTDGGMDVDISDEVFESIAIVEESAAKSLTALVLKLSESTFRPLYYRLYDWAARNPQKKLRNITFFRLSSNIADCLKSLFVLFAGHFLKHAAVLLTSNNPAINEEPQELTMPDETSCISVVESVLETLHKVFLYDSHNFVNQERFETLAQPLVDQIENTIGHREAYERRAQSLIVPCIASFVGAILDDSLHKQLVYQTLLKTRHAKPYVRTAALKALVEIARKLGEDFMPLLPETVPFLAELLEDEDEATEKCAQEAVRTLEDILGEPLQKYF